MPNGEGNLSGKNDRAGMGAKAWNGARPKNGRRGWSRVPVTWWRAAGGKRSWLSPVLLRWAGCALCVLGLFFCSKGGAKEEKVEKQTINKQLERKVTFEFDSAPLMDAVDFIKNLAPINIAIPAEIMDYYKDKPISLRVHNVFLYEALSTILKMVGLTWDIQEEQIWVKETQEAYVERLAVKAEQRREKDLIEERAFQERMAKTAAAQGSGRVKLRLPGEREIEFDQAFMTTHPDWARELLDRLRDPAQDGLLVYRLEKGVQPASIEKVREALKGIGPDLRCQEDPALGVLCLSAEKPDSLRKAAALMRALGFTLKTPKEEASAKSKDPGHRPAENPTPSQPKPEPKGAGQTLAPGEKF